MSDMIYREDAIKAVFQKPAIHGSDGSWYHADDIKDALENAPSADRPQGEWIVETDNVGNTYGRCSICGMRQYAGQLNYCPDCGARMKGVADAHK